MQWLQFFASIIGTLAWRIGVVFLGIMFRTQLKHLFGKVKSLKAAGLEAAFAEETERVAEVAQATLETSSDMKVLDSPMGREFVPKANERPSVIILDSWRDLEEEVLNMINKMGIEKTQSGSMRDYLESLKDYVPTGTRVFIDELQSLRNQVAHNRDSEPDQGTAYQYHISTKNVIQSLRKRTEDLLDRK